VEGSLGRLPTELAEDIDDQAELDEDPDTWPGSPWKPSRPGQLRRLEELTSPEELAKMPASVARWLISFLEGPPANCTRAQQLYLLTLIGRVDRGRIGELIEDLREPRKPRKPKPTPKRSGPGLLPAARPRPGAGLPLLPTKE